MGERTTRSDIVKAADELFYRQGYQHTSFAHIADAVGISRGNFYHHFKTKDEILEAVIAGRLASTRTMLAAWESTAEHPADRIRSFIDILIANRAEIMRHGCPVGTLCAELAKLEHPSRTTANELFGLFRTWLGRQFALLGHEAAADMLAMHLLAQSQGVATLANAFRDAAFVEREVERLYDWLAAQMPEHSREEDRMFIVLLKFAANRARAGELMEGHKAWIERGFDDGVFLLTGSLRQGQGGAIVAHNTSLPDLQRRVDDDPFVAEGVVGAEILDIATSRADERLASVLG
jgi:TetR/AcrR family transcriptional repressor of nem operon